MNNSIVTRNSQWKLLVILVLALAGFFAVFGALVFAQATGYSISFSSQEILSGEPIVLSWSAPDNRTSRSDWIGLYEVGAVDTQYKVWRYVQNSENAGSVSLSYNRPGTYEVRMFTGNKYDRVATSNNTITIRSTNGVNNPPPGSVAGESGSYSVTVAANSYQIGDQVQVLWSTPDNRTSRGDWVGLYVVGNPDRSYERWRYVPNADAQGTIQFPLQKAGEYEVRFFTNNGYTKAAETDSSFSVQVIGNVVDETPDENDDTGGDGSYSVLVTPNTLNQGDTITVEWSVSSGVRQSGDWIGLYKVGNLDRSYEQWRYVSGQTSGSLTFVPRSVGAYEVRFFKNNGYTKVATSPTFTVSSSTETDGVADIQCSVSNVADTSNFPPRSGPVIAFGDSLTSGVGSTAGQDYPNQLSRLLGVSVRNAGISGNTTRDALFRLEQDVLSQNPSVVIVWLGGNDILQRYYERVQQGLENPGLLESVRVLLMRITGKLPEPSGISEDETFANIQMTIERIQARGAVVIVVGFSGGVFDANLENRYAQVANNTDALYVPNVMQNVIGRPSLMSDLVHPNNAGYAIVAERIGRVLSCVL